MKKIAVILTGCMFLICETYSQKTIINKGRTTNVMGWSSWNNYKININEEIIKDKDDEI